MPQNALQAIQCARACMHHACDSLEWRHELCAVDIIIITETILSDILTLLLDSAMSKTCTLSFFVHHASGVATENENVGIAVRMQICKPKML